MSMHKTLVQIFCALLLVAVHAAVAHAQVYAAKFTCGRVPQPAAGDGDTDVVVGVYMTSINIYNPLKEHPQIFHKRVVVANQESEETSQQPGPSAERDDLLPGLAAVRVDCPLIYRLLKDTTEPQSHIEGFVVLEPEPWIPEPLILAVVGKYSARPSNGEVSSLDVVVYTPTQITR